MQRERRAHAEPTTATGVLKVVRKRPVFSAIAVPLAAGALIAGGSVAVGSGGDGATVSATTGESQSVAMPQGKAPSAQSQDEFSATQKHKAKKIAKKNEARDSDMSFDAPESSEPADSSSSAGTSGSGGSDSSDSDSDSTPSGVSYPECNKSQSVEKHFQPNAKKVYRAVCAKFPQVSSFGGYRNDPGSDHGTGHAVDIMISSSVGDQIRDYAIKNKGKLGVKYVIWQQKIYASYTGWNGRPMEDRGSKTANHYDHVHVSVN